MSKTVIEKAVNNEEISKKNHLFTSKPISI